MSIVRKTAARRAVDRAAKACGKAYDALSAMSRFLPEGVQDRHAHWRRELAEYADHLERVTWPDKPTRED